MVEYNGFHSQPNATYCGFHKITLITVTRRTRYMEYFSLKGHYLTQFSPQFFFMDQLMPRTVFGQEVCDNDSGIFVSSHLSSSIVGPSVSHPRRSTNQLTRPRGTQVRR